MWRHGGHVEWQEEKRFSPLGTQLYFPVNSSRKNSIVHIVIHYGCLVTWLQTKYNVHVLVNFLSQVIFVFPLFLEMVMHANEVETKDK